MSDVIGRSNGKDEIRFLNPKALHHWHHIEKLTIQVKKDVFMEDDVNTWKQVRELAVHVVSCYTDWNIVNKVYGGSEPCADMIVDIIKAESRVIVECEQMATDEADMMYNLHRQRY